MLSTGQQLGERLASYPLEDAQSQGKKQKLKPVIVGGKGEPTPLSPEEEHPFCSIPRPKSQVPETKSTAVSPLGLFEKVPCQVRTMIYRYVLEPPKLFPLDRDRRIKLHGHRRLQNTDILWTCKDIYQGAVELLYQETTISVHGEDIYHLEADFACVPKDPELKVPRKSSWRHNPLGGPHTWLRRRYSLEYDMPTLDGFMEPPVFSRFQRIKFVMPVTEINFGPLNFVTGYPRANLILKDEPCEVKREFLKFVAKVNIPRILGRILNNSPCIEQLDLEKNMTGILQDPACLAKIQYFHHMATLETAR
ncbi:hypothetical protein IFR05_011863 [Cadophora sp. M221]|nr:hypothetical protein IFR05_011863 [Cadophora sp. M221]